MIENEEQVRQHLADLIHQLKTEMPEFATFRFTITPEDIEDASGGWAIPVHSDAEDVSAYDVARAIDRIQEELEKRTNEMVVVFLDISPDNHRHNGA